MGLVCVLFTYASSALQGEDTSAESCIITPKRTKDCLSPLQQGTQVMDVPIAANVLGTLGAICWSVQV